MKHIEARALIDFFQKYHAVDIRRGFSILCKRPLPFITYRVVKTGRTWTPEIMVYEDECLSKPLAVMHPQAAMKYIFAANQYPSETTATKYAILYRNDYGAAIYQFDHNQIDHREKLREILRRRGDSYEEIDAFVVEFRGIGQFADTWPVYLEEVQE